MLISLLIVKKLYIYLIFHITLYIKYWRFLRKVVCYRLYENKNIGCAIKKNQKPKISLPR